MSTRRMSETSGISKTTRQDSGILRRRLARKMPITSRNPELAEKIAQMRLTIAPIVHVQTGLPGPDYPSTMLNLFLLTEEQLDQLAHFYSQSSPNANALTYAYPQTMDWSLPFLCKDDSLPANCKLSDLERLKVKMRMFARFIGMRGAETPQWEYEKQVEILRNKVARSVAQEEASRRKIYFGPSYRP
jgi:hypothetical protein